MPVCAAAQQVGHVSELVAVVVEQIECATDLARAQQVSKTWNYEIARSRVCHERLFKIPVTEQEFVSPVVPINARMAPMVTWRMLRRVSATTERQPLDQVVAAVHPLIGGPKQYYAGGFVDFDRLLSLSSGPWQDMFLSQPPAKEAVLTVHYTLDDGPYLHEPKTVKYSASLDGGGSVDFRRLVKELRATCYVADSDFWTWLPDAYSHETGGKPKILLDDYIASYGFPRPVKAMVELRPYISTSSEHYLRLRRQPLRPHPGNRTGDDDVWVRYCAFP